jgi:hypothetical protein
VSVTNSQKGQACHYGHNECFVESQLSHVLNVDGTVVKVLKSSSSIVSLYNFSNESSLCRKIQFLRNRIHILLALEKNQPIS